MVLLVGVLAVGVSAEARPNFNDPTEVTGELTAKGDDFFVNGMELEIDDADRMFVGDINGDGTVLSVEMELMSLVGKEVKIKGFRDNQPEKSNDLYVTEINGVELPVPRP
jgi:hypothetical protein